MIFASDLDRTLIYSEKHIKDFNNVSVIETLNEQNISHMTNKQIELLKEIHRNAFFIPVTTRNLDQYRRVALLQEINPKYFIVNNGGTIYIDGNEDLDWKNYIQDNIKILKYDYNQILELVLSRIDKEYISKSKLSDNLLWVIITNKEIPDTLYNEIEEEIKQYNWTFTRTGRKLYIIPAFMSKWKALDYLNNKYLKTTIISSGDSNLDHEMVVNSHIGIIPSHGEIAETHKENVVITQREGILAGEDILKIVINLI